MASRAVPGGAVPAGGRFAGASSAVFRRGRPAGKRVRGVGVPGADLPEAATLPDPCRGAGANVRVLVRGGAGLARGCRGADEPGSVEPAAGAARPAGPVVPLSPLVP